MTARHLWEYEHPYYCSESNYFNNECTLRFSSWASFLKEEGDADLDMNLVFRWDWKDSELSADEDLNQDELCLFYVGQRKGLFRSVIVQLDKRDEGSVRDWLLARAAHIRVLWEPLIPPLSESPPPTAPEPYTREPDEYKKGTCECCSSERVRIASYRSGVFPNDETNRWMCALCATTHIGNWDQYRTLYKEGQRDIGKAIAFAANSVIGRLCEIDGAEARQKAVEAFIAEMRTLSDRARKERL